AKSKLDELNAESVDADALMRTMLSKIAVKEADIVTNSHVLATFDHNTDKERAKVLKDHIRQLESDVEHLKEVIKRRVERTRNDKQIYLRCIDWLRSVPLGVELKPVAKAKLQDVADLRAAISAARDQ